MPGCVIILPKMVSKRLDLSFGIFARRGEKYSCYACFPLVLGDELAVFVVVEAGKGDIGKGRLEVISDDLDV